MTIRCASPSTIAVLPTPGSPMSTGLDHPFDFGFPADERIEVVIQRGVGEVARELHEAQWLLDPGLAMLFGGATAQLFAHHPEPETALSKDFGGNRFLFAQEAEQDVLGPDMLVLEPVGLLGGRIERSLALVGKGKVHGSGDLLANERAAFDFLSNAVDGGIGLWEEPVGQVLVFPDQPEQEVLGLDVRTAKLTRFVAREEYYAASLFRIFFEHRIAFVPSRLNPLYGLGMKA